MKIEITMEIRIIDEREKNYARVIDRKNEIVESIKESIEKIMGLTFQQFADGKSKKNDFVFARMIFSNHLRNYGFTYEEIGKMIHRDHSSVVCSVKKFSEEKQTNKHFAQLVNKIDEILKK